MASSDNLTQLQKLVVEVRQAQLAQLDAEDQAAAAKAFRALDQAIRGIYELNLSLTQVPAGPLRDCVKEVAPYFEHRVSRWAIERPLEGGFYGGVLSAMVQATSESVHHEGNVGHRTFFVKK